MPYVKKVWETGAVIEVEKVHIRKQKKERTEKIKPTIESQKEINKREAIKKLTRLLNKNFHYGDAHVVLTYALEHRPGDQLAARVDIEKFHRTMRRAYRKLGKKYKYIAISENGKSSIHHHLVINRADIEILNSCWPHGRVRIFMLDKNGQYKKLAAYLVKQTNNTFSDPARRIAAKRWCQSSNLKIPKAKIKTVSANSWTKVPKVPVGYVLEDFEVGVSEAGYPYQFYTLRKVNFFEG